MECSICYESAKITTECNHHFCLDCLAKWLIENKKTCPCCRRELNNTSFLYTYVIQNWNAFEEKIQGKQIANDDYQEIFKMVQSDSKTKLSRQQFFNFQYDVMSNQIDIADIWELYEEHFKEKDKLQKFKKISKNVEFCYDTEQYVLKTYVDKIKPSQNLKSHKISKRFIGYHHKSHR